MRNLHESVHDLGIRSLNLGIQVPVQIIRHTAPPLLVANDVITGASPSSAQPRHCEDPMRRPDELV